MTPPTAEPDLKQTVEGLVEALRDACAEVKDLRRYANNHGGMWDEEEYSEGLGALSRAEACLAVVEGRRASRCSVVTTKTLPNMRR